MITPQIDPTVQNEDVNGSAGGISSAVVANAKRLIGPDKIRGVSAFTGMGEAKPYGIPERSVLFSRVSNNAKYFATNYAIFVIAVAFITILLNPLFIFWAALIFGAWFYAIQSLGENPTKLAGFTVSTKARNTTLSIVAAILLLYFGGHILSTIILASGVCIAAHITLRAFPLPDDEFGFMADFENNVGELPSKV